MSDRDKFTPHSKEETRSKEQNSTQSQYDDPPPPYPGIPGADITSDKARLMSSHQQPQDQPKLPPHDQPTQFPQPSAPPENYAPYPNTQGPQPQGPDLLQPKPYHVNPNDHSGTYIPLSANSAPNPNTHGPQSQQPYPVQANQYPIDDKGGRYIPLKGPAPYLNTQAPQGPYPVQQPPYPVNAHQSGTYVPLTTHEGYPVYVHQTAVMTPVPGPARRQADDDCSCSECLDATYVCCEFTRCLVACIGCLVAISK